MLEVEGQIKKWGNSIGLRLRKDQLLRNRFKVNEKVRVLITPKRTIRGEDLWGVMQIKKNTGEIMKEIDRELDSKI